MSSLLEFMSEHVVFSFFVLFFFFLTIDSIFGKQEMTCNEKCRNYSVDSTGVVK